MADEDNEYIASLGQDPFPGLMKSHWTKLGEGTCGDFNSSFGSNRQIWVSSGFIVREGGILPLPKE